MAITKIDPPAFEEFNTVQVDSDATTRIGAIHEMDDWAYEHGFSRTPEYWVRILEMNGRRVYRGVCYRPDPAGELTGGRVGAEASL